MTDRYQQKKSSARAALLSSTATESVAAQFTDRSELGRQHRKFTFDRRDLLFVGRAAQRFFSPFLRFQRLGFVKVMTANRRIGQHCHHRGLHLEYAAGDENQLLFATTA